MDKFTIGLLGGSAIFHFSMGLSQDLPIASAACGFFSGICFLAFLQRVVIKQSRAQQSGGFTDETALTDRGE